MRIPTDYIEGYEAARAVDSELADDYIAHTHIGDPEADAFIEALAPSGQDEASRVIQAGIQKNEDILRDAPQAARDFFESIETPPDWVDFDSFDAGVRMFHRNSRLILGAFVGGVLVEGFSTNISKSFMATGRLFDQGVRRLKQNNRHMVESFMPGGLERQGDGWALSVRVRLVHAQVRYLLNNSLDWDLEAWGEPISAAHMGYATAAFSARLLKHLKSLGADFNDEERASFMAVWRYTGHLMGVPASILFRDEAEALHLFEIARMCEPPPDYHSIAMANALINSAPLVIGIDNSFDRRLLSKYVYGVSRALIGDELANALNYPHTPTLGMLAMFRLEGRYNRLVSKRFPKLARASKLGDFMGLMQGSAFDEAGISYRLPDHLYAEQGSSW